MEKLFIQRYRTEGALDAGEIHAEQVHKHPVYPEDFPFYPEGSRKSLLDPKMWTSG